MNKLKNLGTTFIGLAIFLGLILLASIFFVGGLKIAEIINPILVWLVGICTVISVIVLIPLSFFKKTRPVSAISLYVISTYIFGLSLWVYSFLAAYDIWGFFGLILGLLGFGVGVVPVAFVASLLAGKWAILGNIVYAILLTYGSRILAVYLAAKADQQAEIKEFDMELPEHTEWQSNNGETFQMLDAQKLPEPPEKLINDDFANCPGCRTKLSEETRFCKNCGLKVNKSNLTL